MKSQNYDELSPHEQLFIHGKLIDFEKAILASNKQEATLVLESVGFSVESAKDISYEILANPRKYGYCRGGCLQQNPGAANDTQKVLMM